MSEPAVTKQDLGRVRIIRLNRPEALNAMNQSVFSGLADALTDSEKADDIAVAIVTGEGRAFCAGLDLTESGQTEENNFPRLRESLSQFNKPLIAAVNGVGVGVGLTMLAYCDLVFMSRLAKLRTPFPQLGLAPEAGSSFTLASRIGWQNAAYVLMSGRFFTAEECQEMGLVWRLSEPDDLLDDALQVARELAENPIPSLVATKQLMLNAGLTVASQAAHDRETDAYADLMGAPANREAFAAFRDKRDPDFSKIPGL